MSTFRTLLLIQIVMVSAAVSHRHHRSPNPFMDMPNMKDFFKLMKEPTPFAKNITTLDDFFTLAPVDTTPATPLAMLRVGDFAQCLALLEQVLAEAYKAYNEAKEKEWSQLIPTVIQIAKDAYDDFNCFKDSDKKQFAKDAFNVMINMGDQKQCILDNLSKAVQNAEDLVLNIFSESWDEITAKIGDIVQNVQDAVNCQ